MHLFSLYHTASALHLYCKDQSVNLMWANNHCLFWEPYLTHKCALWAEHRLFKCQTWFYTDQPLDSEGVI